MVKFDYDLGIIGGGAAGLTAAAGGAQFGAKTLLIEKTDRLGGDCLHTGCVPSKTLIRTAQVWSLARRTAEFGLPELPLPRVDLHQVMARVDRVIAALQAHDTPERFQRLGAEVRFGAPCFLDPHTVEIDGQKVSAGAWIIATGSRPAIPLVEGLGNLPYWTNENVFRQQNLPGRLVVLGAGPIGVELAQAFARLGSRVVLIEYGRQILGAEDPDMAAFVAERLEAEGVEIHLATSLLKVEQTSAGIRLTVEMSRTSGPPRLIKGDALLVATGRRPNIEGLGLQAAGVVATGEGIGVDDRLRTSALHIYACGDVTGNYPFTHVAGYEAGVALTNAILHLPRKADYGTVAWCTYSDPELASVGFNEKRARQAGIDYRTLEEEFAGNDRAQTEAEARGKIKVVINGRGKPIGCQIVGPHAGELIHEWVAVLHGDVRLSTLAGAIHTYPTLSEISKKAASDYVAEKLFSDRVRKFLHLIFRLQGTGPKENRS